MHSVTECRARGCGDIEFDKDAFALGRKWGKQEMRMSELESRMNEIKIARRVIKALKGLSEEGWRRVLEMVRGEMEAKP